MKKRSGFVVMLRLIGLVKPLGGYMLLAITMGLIGHLCASFITILGAYGAVNVMGIDNSISLTAIFIMLGVFALIRGVLRYAEQACNHFIAFKLLALIRDKVFRALRRLCPAKLEGKDKGNLISIITSDIELLEVFYAHTISPTAIAILFNIIMTVFIGRYHVALGIIAIIGYITIGGIVPVITSRLSGDDGISFRTKSGELSAFVLDSLRGLTEILQFGQGEKRLAEMNKQTDNLNDDERKLKATTGKNQAVTNTLILMFDMVMLFTSAWLYRQGKLEFIGVVIPTVAMMSTFGPCVALAALGSTLQNTFAAGNRVLDILEEEPAVQDITGKENTAFDGAKTEKLTFSYDSEVILEDLTLEIPKGAVIGIEGRSGSGKSTLLKLFMRFWETENGKVSISDKDIKNINTNDLRDMESYVTQDTHLFHDSIANNLRIAKQDATDEEMQNACKKASVHDFIMGLKNGYNTPIGELGDTLSGGEKQRIGLARAFLHNADFMLLDEPTSNLDSLNEAVILKSIEKERGNKTVVMVSHRKSTMSMADKIYSVEHGRIS